MHHYIYHEKQDGRLCAKHALNSLLQGNYFDAFDLADIGRQLDNAECEQLARRYGQGSDQVRNFISAESKHYDDSGYFSLSVICRALKTFDIDLISWKKNDDPNVLRAQAAPELQKAYICNDELHWFTLRKFGETHWYNLNSVFSRPKPVPQLASFVRSLIDKKSHVFVVVGQLPFCKADDYFAQYQDTVRLPVHQTSRSGTEHVASSSSDQNDEDDVDKELQRAILNSYLRSTSWRSSKS